MDNEQIVALLRKDMEGEHQAIIQYLNHAYTMGREDLAPEIEAIAREEMRHLDWLADLIGELGGDPSLQRDSVDFSRAAAPEQMRKDVGLEETAVRQYRAHIDAIDKEHVRQVLSRILHDEQAHKRIFEGLVEMAAQEPCEPETIEEAPPAQGKPPARLLDILNEGVRHEYTVILQYLYHSFMAEDKELMEGLQNVAINEMQHMGWLSEEVAEKGGQPDMSHTALFLSADAARNLQADIAAEREVTKAYNAQLPEIDDPDLVALIERIRDHEIFHDQEFSYLLDEVQGEGDAGAPDDETPPTIPSVGSLKRKD
jgi:bacterioferritin